MDSANQEIIKEDLKNRLTEVIRVYKNRSSQDAPYWASLLLAVPGFSSYYYRTHLLLGEKGLYRLDARKRGDVAIPKPVDWFLKDGPDTGRMEDMLDQRVYLSDGRITEPVVGLDIPFKRILTDDGKVYQLRLRIAPPKEVAVAMLLSKQ